MRSFCTLYDKNYLYQGVALYQSLERHSGPFKLYVLCMDAEAHALLTKFRFEHLVPIAVDELLTDDVKALRARTTHGQFCWACQPLICQFVLDRFGCEMVTYLEADSLFFADPEVLFQELGDRSVSLVPHNYAPGCDNTQVAGVYCVQFNAFRNDAAGRAVLQFWRENCFRYSKDAPLSYPGQTCLDEWPQRFAGVGVIKHLGAGVAPWNVQQYRFEIRDGTPHVDGVPVVFYHYHEYGRLANGCHELGNYVLSPEVVTCIYGTYARALDSAEQLARSVDPAYRFRRTYPNKLTLAGLIRSPGVRNAREYARLIRRRLRGTFNVVPPDFFSGS